jgi:signal transduction histidine kinase
MSATATNDLSTLRPSESRPVQAFFYLVGCLVVGYLAAWTVTHASSVTAALPELILWVIVATVADAMSVTCWQDVFLTMSLPVTLAAAMLFDPAIAGLITFLGAFDPREFSREVSFDRALYNRSQVAVCVMAASTGFHILGGHIDRFPEVLPIAVATLAIDYIVNTCLVMIPVGLMNRISPQEALRLVYGATWKQHIAGYVSLGLLAIALASLVATAETWGLLIMLPPFAVVREMFVQARRAEEGARAVEVKNKALLAASQSVASERRDERLVVAGELHDEVLPPLFKVHLMGQVIRRDLDAGRLLDLDGDLPELLSATEAAQDAIRGLLHELRRSPLGPGGLQQTLRLLADQIASRGDTRIAVQMASVDADSLVQLLAYQVVREALHNAEKHARAKNISVRIWTDDSSLRLVVEDDGVGFQPEKVDRDRHFGLQLLAERVRASGGQVLVDSAPGEGTRLVATLPRVIQV